MKSKLRTVFVNVLLYSFGLRQWTIYLVTFILLRLRAHFKGSLRPTCSMQFDNALNGSFNYVCMERPFHCTAAQLFLTVYITIVILLFSHVYLTYCPFYDLLFVCRTWCENLARFHRIGKFGKPVPNGVTACSLENDAEERCILNDVTDIL